MRAIILHGSRRPANTLRTHRHAGTRGTKIHIMSTGTAFRERRFMREAKRIRGDDSIADQHSCRLKDTEISDFVGCNRLT